MQLEVHMKSLLLNTKKTPNPTLKFAPFGRWDAPSARLLASLGLSMMLAYRIDNTYAFTYHLIFFEGVQNANTYGQRSPREFVPAH